MGKLGKTVVDQIHALLEEGYNQKEVATKLGINRKTVASYAPNSKMPTVLGNLGNMGLPPDSEITQLLFKMQGVMGTPTLVGAVRQAYLDTVALTKLKVTHWPVYAEKGEVFTVESMIERLVNFIDILETDQREWFNSLREAIAEKKRLKVLVEERFEAGLEQGRDDHAIYVRCAYCGEPYQVTPLSEAHGEITSALLDLGWGHSSCVRKVEYDHRAGSRA